MRLFALVMFMTLLLPFSQALAECGKFVVVKGNVLVDFAKDKRSDRAVVGTEVCSGDAIRAGADSRAKIVMVDNNELNISPDTVLKIATYEYKPEENKKKVLLDVLKGKVRSTVKQKYDGQASTYQVKTKAAVAGVRGTDFVVAFDPKMGKLELVTFEGRVEVGQLGRNGIVVPDVAVTAGNMTEVMMGQSAEAPKAMPASELKQMDSDTQAATPSPRASDRTAQTPSRNGGEKSDNRQPAMTGGELMPPPPPPPPPPIMDSCLTCGMPAMPTPLPNMMPDGLKDAVKGTTNLNVQISTGP